MSLQLGNGQPMTFDMRFSSGAELPTDFVDSVPVSDVEAKGGGSRIFVMNTNLNLCVNFFQRYWQQ